MHGMWETLWRRYDRYGGVAVKLWCGMWSGVGDVVDWVWDCYSWSVGKTRRGDAGMEKVYCGWMDGRQCVGLTNMWQGKKTTRWSVAGMGKVLQKETQKNGDVGKLCDDYIFISIFPLVFYTFPSHIIFLPFFLFLSYFLFIRISLPPCVSPSFFSLSHNWSWIPHHNPSKMYAVRKCFSVNIYIDAYIPFV